MRANVKTVMRETETEELYDSDGVVRDIQSIKYESSPSFFKTFIGELSSLLKTSHAAKKVLFYILDRDLADNEDEISIGLYRKKKMAEDLNFKHTKSIDIAIGNLIDKDVLVRVGRGVFMLNPNLFSKGSLSDLKKKNKKYIELKIKYSKKGRELSLTSE